MFILTFFDENPLSSMSLFVCRDGVCKRVSEMSGSAKNHLAEANALYESGEFSLLNGLELAKVTLKSVPKHGSKEIIVIMASLTTCDQGDIFETIDSLADSKIYTSVIGLSAEVHVAKTVARKTMGLYDVAKDRNHFQHSLMRHVNPPSVLVKNSNDLRCTFVRMGFPSQAGQREEETGATSTRQALSTTYPPTLTTKGFYCPRCNSLVEELPSTCPICNLELIASSHLARSYHHLFPVPPFKAVSLAETLKHADGGSCFACNLKFDESKNLSEYFQCPKCETFVCDICDTFIQECLHNCPGCMYKKSSHV